MKNTSTVTLILIKVGDRQLHGSTEDGCKACALSCINRPLDQGSLRLPWVWKMSTRDPGVVSSIKWPSSSTEGPGIRQLTSTRSDSWNSKCHWITMLSDSAGEMRKRDVKGIRDWSGISLRHRRGRSRPAVHPQEWTSLWDSSAPGFWAALTEDKTGHECYCGDRDKKVIIDYTWWWRLFTPHKLH